jgi:hypothetical protein
MGMAVFSGMLIATIVGVCLIPVLFVVVGRVIGSASAPAPIVMPPTLAPGHGTADQ